MYIDARKGHDHDTAVRAVYLRMIIEVTGNGPTDRAVRLAEQSVWLSQERGSPDVPILPVVALAQIFIERAEPSLAEATLESLDGAVLSATDLLNLVQVEVAHQLMLEQTDGVLERLNTHLAAVERLEADQYTGAHHLLVANCHRIEGDHDAAKAAAVLALDSLAECPNQSFIREAVIEAVRCSLAARCTQPKGHLVDLIDRRLPAGAAYGALLDGLLEADADGLRAAAELLEQQGFRFEALKARLEASELDGCRDRSLPNEARAVGLEWMAARAEAVRPPIPDERTRSLPISERQAEVLTLMALGLSNKDIAARLFISDRTASTHVSAILRRLNCRNRAEAVAVWISAG